MYVKRTNFGFKKANLHKALWHAAPHWDGNGLY